MKNIIIISVFIAVLFAITMSSCGKDDGDSQPQKQEQNTTNNHIGNNPNDEDNGNNPNDEDNEHNDNSEDTQPEVTKYIVTLPDGTKTELEENALYTLPESATNAEGWLVKYYIDGQEKSGQEISVTKDITINQKLFAVATLPDGTTNEVEIGDNEVVPKKIDYYTIKSMTFYDNDETTEIYKTETEFDKLNRPQSTKTYSYGKLATEVINYSYNGLNCTYASNSYSSDGQTIVLTTNYKAIYLDNYYSKMISLEFFRDGEKYMETISGYDEEKCLMDSRIYTNGSLSQETKNFQRDGLKVSYDTYITNGSGVCYHEETEYLDNTFTKILSTQTTRVDLNSTTNTLYEYDKLGRCVSQKIFINDILCNEYTDYTYNGNVVTYYYKSYKSDGTLNSKTKYKVEYL